MSKTLIVFLSLCLAAVAGAVALNSIGVARSFENYSQSGLRGWRTNTDKRSINLAELASGGPPKDGIPAINSPNFISIDSASRWLKPQEPVIALIVGAEARAYPLQILIWHEIVNDRIAGVPVAVTFCPLCYSAVAFERTIDGREYTFGVSGLLRDSDMVMFDRETESFWQQLTGEAIVGDLTGTILSRLPAQIISYEQFSKAYAKGEVLSRPAGSNRNYGRNPYAGYDNVGQRPWLFRGKLDNRLRPMEKVITISVGKMAKAYPYSITRDLRVISDEMSGRPVVIFHGEGAVSALDSSEIRTSRTIGSTGVFDPRVNGRLLHFRYAGGEFIDAETDSTWDITGRAVAGGLQGQQLTPITHGDYFAFAWLAFKPETEIYKK